METVLYADVLFLIDFSMDVVTIWLTASFMHLKKSAKRVCVAAFIGALISVVLTVASSNRITVAVVGITTSFIMSKISFCVRGINAVKYTCTLWITGLLLGGMMSYLISGCRVLQTPTQQIQSEGGGIRLLPIAVLICAVLMYAVGRFSVKKTVNVKVELFGTSIKSVGLVDSGNLLCDPISGQPVVLITRSEAEKLIGRTEVECILCGRTEDADEKLRPRFRAVFAKNTDGETMLPCLRVDEILIDSKPCNALVGVSESDKFTENISSIVPLSLV